MTITNAMLLSLVGLLAASYVAVRPTWRNTGPFLPDSFLLGLLLYGSGAIYLSIVDRHPNSELIATLALVALISALLGTCIFCIARHSYHRRSDFATYVRSLRAGPIERLVIVFGLLLATMVCVLFSYLVLTRFSIAALVVGALSGSGDDLLATRVAITSGSEAYFAPGYVKQFRDILIPIMLSALLFSKRTAWRSILFWTATAAALFAMLLAGQRMIIVIFFASVGIAAYYRNVLATSGWPRITRRLSWLPAAIIAVLVYGLITVLLGRADTAMPQAELVSNIASNALRRIATAAPSENAETLPVWFSLGPTFGRSWLADLSGLMPGVNASFSNILHAATGGSLWGNSPLALPADCWFAFGWPGVLVLPAIYGVALGIFDSALRSYRSQVLFGVRCYLFIAIPVCYSPFLFLLYGGAVSVVLFASIAAIRRRPAVPG